MVEAKDILNLYCLAPNLDWIDQNFDDNVDFEGPGFSSTGKENVIQIFKAIPMYLRSMKVEKHISTTSGRTIMIDTHLLVAFNFFPWVNVSMRMLLTITKNHENRIIKFEESIEPESLIRNIPLLGYMYFNYVKPSFGYAMVRLGGLSTLPRKEANKKPDVPKMSDKIKEQLHKEKQQQNNKDSSTSRRPTAQPVSN
eukprot:gene13304-15639_t